MTVSPGTRLGPYEIVAPIGAGGMGEVYKARDTRLERSVAIKILPADFAHNAQLKVRFEREAKTISQLTHPHICTLYDVGNQSGVEYLVMELLEGETLADRIAKGPLPLDQVLRYGAEIADALDRAHRAGVVHRDLKPGNIMLTKSGAKLLDFGLAKADARVEIVDETGATQQKPLTREGTILGTFQYMAPEQLEGGDADARTDIFALGAVLYEMATGRRAFEGKTRTSVIASIVSGKPRPIHDLQPLTPPLFEHVVETCLAKDPEDRWQSARDAALQMRWIAGAAGAGAVPRDSGRRGRAAWLIAAISLVAAVAFAALFVGARSAHDVAAVTSAIVPPDGVRFAADQSLQLSPDGSRIAFIGVVNGKQQIYVRRTADGTTAPLPQTDGAADVFWSPDGHHLGFFASDKLKRIPAAGGPPQVICDAADARGGTWGADNTIVFGLFRDGLFRVSSGGGTPARLTRMDAAHGEISHRWPLFLPDGEHLLFLAQRAEGGSPDDPSSIDIVTLRSGERKQVVRANSSMLYSPEGHVLFWRGKSLVAQPFSARTLTVSGEAQPVASDVAYTDREQMLASVSRDGMLVYAPGHALRNTRIVWYDRSGKELEEIDSGVPHTHPSVSPDGRLIAFAQADDTMDLWVADASRSAKRRLTVDSADEFAPVWSPDGTQIVYGTTRTPTALWVVPAAGGTARKLVEADNAIPTDWSGDEVLFDFHDVKLKSGIGIVNVRDGRSRILLQTPFAEGGGRFSPDRKWVAYNTDQSGRLEIHVLSLESGERFQVSTTGGECPRWSRNGNEIDYFHDDSIMAVPVATKPRFVAGNAVRLFGVRYAPGSGTSFDVSGDRFLANVSASDQMLQTATVVQNWATLLQEGPAR